MKYIGLHIGSNEIWIQVVEDSRKRDRVYESLERNDTNLFLLSWGEFKKLIKTVENITEKQYGKMIRIK